MRPLTRRPNLLASVQDAIIDAIERGEFKVGGCLPSEQALSMMYGVSRPIIREALICLRARAPFLLRKGHRTYIDPAMRGTRQALSFDGSFSIDDFRKCYAFRRNIESGAARLAALNRDDSDVIPIRKTFHQLHGGSYFEERPVDADFAFHLAIASSSRNPFFPIVLQSVRKQALFTMHLSREFSQPQPPQRMEAVEEEHRRVLEAIVAKDADAAAAAMRFHIDQSMARVLGEGAQ